MIMSAAMKKKGMKIQAHIFGKIVKLEEIKVAGFALRGTSDPLPLIGPSSSSSSLDLRIEGYICIHVCI